ncbi:MAG TPA: glycosyltransferase family 9 protein [Candidatus Sulfotelmatobacter sp.]|nr:glycosyltransferase family 9 protein [Candidatus Sulfotelmatobacter sp.]
MTEPRFLVVRLGSLGDIVHTFPAVAALRGSFPASEIVWLTHPRWKGLVESSALASEIRNVESRDLSSVRATISKIRASQWQSAIDYQGLWKSAALPFLGGVKRRIGFSSHTIREFGVPILYNQRVKPETVHIADQNGELSRRAGARRRVGHVKLSVSGESVARAREELSRAGFSDRYVVLSPGGGWRAKCWPPERFGALCQKLRDALGLRCVVNYGPGEDDLAAAVKSVSGRAEPLVWNTELGPLMALLRSAACIVGGDTGPLHLAIALGTPAVALYGPTDPARNGPYRNPSLVTGDPILDSGEARDTDPCAGDIVLRAAGSATSHSRNDVVDPSMLAIQVDAVFEAVRRRIGAAG